MIYFAVNSFGSCFGISSAVLLEIVLYISAAITWKFRWQFLFGVLGDPSHLSCIFRFFFRFVVIPLNRHGNLQTALKLTFVILLKFIQQLFLEHFFDYVLIISWTVPSGIRITTYLEIQTIKKMVIYNRKNAQMNGGRKFKRPIL